MNRYRSVIKGIIGATVCTALFALAPLSARLAEILLKHDTNEPQADRRIERTNLHTDFRVLARETESVMNIELSGSDPWEMFFETEQDKTVIAAPPEAEEADSRQPYPESTENHDGIIRQTTYSKQIGANFFELSSGAQVKNCTSETIGRLQAQSALLPDYRITLGGEPQVLIMHTHTTESFEPYERDFFDSSFNSRTTDASKNIVMVGDKIAAELNAAGIGVIHDTTIHDYPSYNGSYGRSATTVSSILAQYPSIKIVLDIHRDAITASDGARIAPVAEINGKKAAQIMIISGCDDGTMNMPNYMQNFRLASLIQNRLETDWSGITRPILFDYRKYNQDLTTGSLLIEVGSAANSLDQAAYSGELLGKSLAAVLSGLV